MTDLRLDHVRKSYGAAVALGDLSLEVRDGELMALLGPSGCGKTTTLRIIAGFEAIEQGRVSIGGADVTRLPPRLRNIGVVFQDYALFPHLTVAENVGFGLKMRGDSRADRTAAVREALALVRLDGLDDRLPRQLSGGQQQRVAVARALAIKPRLLLLDEPLSNLDTALREELRDEICRVQRLVGITTVFVTHDQGEALAMSDRITVMRAGAIVQIGSPTEIYEWPNSPFVASFIGRAALLHGRVTAAGGGIVQFETGDGQMLVGRGGELRPGEAVDGVVRTERIRLVPPGAPALENTLDATVVGTTYLGSATRIACAAGAERIDVMQTDPGGRAFSAGEPVRLGWSRADCIVLAAPAETPISAFRPSSAT